MNHFGGLLIIAILVLTSACIDSGPVKNSKSIRPINFSLDAAVQGKRGELIEAKHLVSMSKADLRNKLKSVLLPLKADAKNGIHIYRIRYQTQLPQLVGQAIEASGILIIPDNSNSFLPWISVQHGTIVDKADAPSVNPYEGIFEASQGFVTVVMDYIGYGASSEYFHPYLVAQAYADAGVDMLKAAYRFAGISKIGTGPLFLKGYSEGGFATLALQKELESNYPEFPLSASAPAAGPYNLDQTANLLLTQTEVNPVNVSFVVLSYARWLAADDFNADNVFKLRSTDLQFLFSGIAGVDSIESILPSKTRDLLQADFVDDFLSLAPSRNESVKLHAWLQNQSLSNKPWKPLKSTTFWHCLDDEEVPFAVSADTAELLKSPLVSLIAIKSPEDQKYTHATCPAIYLPVLKFAESMNPVIGQ